MFSRHVHRFSTKALIGSAIVLGILWTLLLPDTCRAVEVQVSAGSGHGLAIKNDGTLLGWGLNNYGQTGISPMGTNLLASQQIGTEKDWRFVAAGSSAESPVSCAIKADGSLYTWGNNRYGQLGKYQLDGDNKISRYENNGSPNPFKVTGTWIQVSASDHVAAIRSDGTLWTWGRNDSGQLGRGDKSIYPDSIPTQVGTATDWAQVSVGATMTLAIKKDGRLFAWGGNLGGQLGDGTKNERLVPSQVGSDSDWQKVTAGADFVQAIKKDGSRWAWGANTLGELGFGYIAGVDPGLDQRSLSPSTEVPAAVWTDIVSGAGHTLGIRSDGSVWSWGKNLSGQLGTGSAVSLNWSPQKITTGYKIAAGGAFSVIVSEMGDTSSCGLNSAGQLANGTTTSRNTLSYVLSLDLGDGIPPVISSFTLPPFSKSLTVPISSLSASDNSASWWSSYTGLNGYYLSESPSAPIATSQGWTFSKPTSFTFSGTGARTLYAWVRDDADNVSAPKSVTVTIDMQVPTVTADPPGFTYLAAQNVKLVCTDTTGSGCASISYCTGAACTPNQPYIRTTTIGIQALTSTVLRYRALDQAGNSSPIMEEVYVIPQNIGPTTATYVALARVEAGRSVLLTYNQAVGTTALVAANYTLSGSGKGNLAVNPGSVTQVSPAVYRLVWNSGKMFKGGDITITVQNVKDTTGANLQYITSATHTGGAVAIAPVVTATPKGGSYGSSQTVTLACSDGYGAACAELLSCTGSACTPTQAYVNPIDVTFDKDSRNDVIIRSKGSDGAGNSSAILEQVYHLGMSFNNEATSTTDRNVILFLTTTGDCTSISVVNDAETPQSIPCTANTPWLLPDADGAHSVTATYTNSHTTMVNNSYPCNWQCSRCSSCNLFGCSYYDCNCGYRSTCDNWQPQTVQYQYTSTASIILDRKPPTVTMTPAAGFMKAEPLLTLGCDDGAAGSGCKSIVYCTGSGCAPSLPYLAPLQLTDDAIVRYRATDNAGLVSAIKESAYYIDKSPPEIRFVKPTLNGMKVTVMTSGVAFTVSDGLGSGLSCPSGQICGKVKYRVSSQVNGEITYWGIDNGSLVAGVAADNAWFQGYNNGTSYSMNQANLNALPMNTYTIEVQASDAIGNLSGIVSYNVYKVPEIVPESTVLSLDLSNTSIPYGESIDIAGSLSRYCPSGVCETAVDLASRKITIAVTDPDNVASYFEVTTKNLDGQYIIEKFMKFTKQGVHTIQAFYNAGEEDLYASKSKLKTVLVGKPAGYAIIIEGMLPTDPEGIKSHTKSARRAWKTLKERNFTDANIFWFNQGPVIDPANGSFLPVNDTAPNLQKVAGLLSGTTPYAGGQTLAQLMDANPAPIYLIMIDHGSQNKFHLGSDIITPEDLDGWLTALNTKLTSQQARDEKSIIIIGACYSGSFIRKPLSAPGRIIITSAGSGEQSYRGGHDGEDSVQSGEYFLDELFAGLKRFSSIRTAFAEAAEKTWKYTRKKFTATNSEAVFSAAVQHPFLDDNGDGVGNFLVTDTAEGDGSISSGLYLGTASGVNSIDDPADLNAVAQTIYIPAGSNTLPSPLWASSTNRSQVSSVWVELMKPSSSNNTTDPQYPTGQLSRSVEPSAMTPSAGRFEYTGFTFNDPGRYEATYYAIDKETGNPSPSKRTVIYLDLPDNDTPLAPTPVEPDQNGKVTDPESGNKVDPEKTILFKWNGGSDTHAITYRLDVCTDDAFSENCITRDEIAETYYLLNDPAIKYRTGYYWKVSTVDSYGKKSASQTFNFTTNAATNPDMPGIITGYLYSDSGKPIADATIDIEAINSISTVKTLYNGAFIKVTPANVYKITAKASGYQSKIMDFIQVKPGKVFDASTSLVEKIALNQTIIFDLPATATYGDAPIVLDASGGGSGNPVTFSVVSGPAMLNGSTLTMTGAGNIAIKASQAGNSDYAAAVDVQKTIVVAPKLLTITATNASRTYGADNPVNPGFTAPALVGSDSIDRVTYTYAATAIATADVGSVHSITPGSVLFASGIAANYSISYVAGTLTIAGTASQTITFNPPAAATYGDTALVLVASGGDSGNPVTFSVVSGPATLNGATLTITGAGTITVKASQAGNNNYAAAIDVQKTIVVAPKLLTIIASVPGGHGTVSCSSPVNYGTTSDCTITADSGYQLATFTDNNDDKKSSVTNGSYSLSTVTANHTIMVTFSPRTPVNGSCGSSNGKSFLTMPTTDLCSSGTAVTVNGAGTWMWICTGENGGTTAGCTANMQTAGKPGDCDSNGIITITEVQSAIDIYLQIKPVANCVDMNGDNKVTISEVQTVINGY